MELGALPLGDPGVKPDPGNNSPDVWSEDLSDDELREAMDLVETEISPTLDGDTTAEVSV